MTEYIDKHSRRWRVELEPDDTSDPPWERSDGHGPVRETRLGYSGRPADKRPGEVVLHAGRHGAWLYDRQAALKIAIKDGWGADEEYARTARRLYPGSKKSRALMAVDADEAFLRGWLSGDWWYVGVVVTLLGDDGEEVDSESLWGIESCANDYLEEVAHELIDEMAARHKLRLCDRLANWRAALREARERRFWACRDVVTT